MTDPITKNNKYRRLLLLVLCIAIFQDMSSLKQLPIVMNSMVRRLQQGKAFLFVYESCSLYRTFLACCRPFWKRDTDLFFSYSEHTARLAVPHHTVQIEAKHD